MSVKSGIRSLARKFGVEINRYNSAQSLSARVGTQLACHGIDCVLDVGANDGGYGRFLRSTGFRGDIVSFEPQSEAYERLLRASQADPRWHIAPQIALGRTEGELEINIAGNSASSSLLQMLPTHIESAPQSRVIGREKVIVRRLDEVDIPAMRAAERMYLKIDTQGYEMPVLLGAEKILDKVVGIQMEMSVTPLYEGQVLYQELLTWLNEAGFEMWGLIPGFMNQASGRMLQFDGIFYRT